MHFIISIASCFFVVWAVNDIVDDIIARTRRQE